MYRHPTQVKKIWGEELVIHNSPLYCGKIINIGEGMSTSLHYHQQKVETFYISKGVALIFLIDRGNTLSSCLKEGSIVEVPKGVIHRVSSPFGELSLVEFSTQHLEHDTVRL